MDEWPDGTRRRGSLSENALEVIRWQPRYVAEYDAKVNACMYAAAVKVEKERHWC